MLLTEKGHLVSRSGYSDASSCLEHWACRSCAEVSHEPAHTFSSFCLKTSTFRVLRKLGQTVAPAWCKELIMEWLSIRANDVEEFINFLSILNDNLFSISITNHLLMPLWLFFRKEQYGQFTERSRTLWSGLKIFVWTSSIVTWFPCWKYEKA